MHRVFTYLILYDAGLWKRLLVTSCLNMDYYSQDDFVVLQNYWWKYLGVRKDLLAFLFVSLKSLSHEINSWWGLFIFPLWHSRLIDDWIILQLNQWLYYSTLFLVSFSHNSFQKSQSSILKNNIKTKNQRTFLILQN